MLRGNLLARGDFDRLPIPFRAVATRLNDGRGVVFQSGDLGRAVRASMSVPIVFDPVVIDGDRLVDGALFANVPVGPARAAGAQRVIVSDVSEGLADTLDSADSAPAVRVMSHLVSLLSSQAPDSLGPEDAEVRMALTRYGLLDFSDADDASRSSRTAGARPPPRSRRHPASPAPPARRRRRGSRPPSARSTSRRMKPGSPAISPAPFTSHRGRRSMSPSSAPSSWRSPS